MLIVFVAIGVEAVTSSGIFSFEASDRSVVDASEDVTAAVAANDGRGLAGVAAVTAFALLAAAFFCFFIACLLF